MTQLTGLHAKFTGDASGFVNSAKLAAFELNKLKAKQTEAKRAADAAATSTETLAKKYRQLQLETDAVAGAMDRFQRASELVRKVADSQKWSQEQLGAELTRLANHYGVAEQAGYRMNDQVRSARFHSANLAAQFNDIAVMMASGQSPFTLAMQQGTQISQVFNSMGGTVRQQMATLGRSMLSIINPTSLLTIGLIAGAAALFQWGLSASGSTAKAEALKAKQDELKASLEALTEATKKLRLERQMADTGIATELEQNTVNQINELLRQQAEIRERINNAKTVGRGVGAQTVADAEIAELKASERSLEVQIQALRYQELLAQAAHRRANEVRNQYREEKDGQDAVKYMQDLINDSANDLRFIIADIAASDIASVFSNALGPLSALVTKARELSNGLGMSSGPAGPAKVPSGLGAEVKTLFGNVPVGLGGTAPMSSSIRPRSAPEGTGGVEWGLAAGGGGGGGGAASKIQQELEALQSSLLTQEQLEMESYARRKEVLNQALAERLITQEAHQKMMEQVNETHNFKMLQQTNRGVSSTLSALGSLFQGSKKIGAAVAVANSWLAFTEVLKDPAYVGRPWARFGAAAAALSSGLNAVRNIKSASPGGSTGGGVGAGGGDTGGGAAGGGGRSQSVVLNLMGGDMFSRPQVLSLINAINEASEDGARIRLA